MSHPEEKYITAKESLKILNISSVRTLQRYRDKHDIDIRDIGQGKPKLYLKSDIEKIAKPKKDIKKYIPPKTKKIIKKKETIQKKRIEKNTETKQTAKVEAIKAGFNPLNELGQDEFQRVYDLLQTRGTYKDEDRSIIVSYAISFQNYILAIKISNENDNTTTDDFGNLKVHPYFTIADKSLTQMNKLSVMLGIGARSRIGLEIKEKKKASMFDVMNEKEEF